jgi:hypothetical protein
MSLTLVVEQRLVKVRLTDFFLENRAMWTGLAQKTYDFVEDMFPDDAVIRPDDIAKELRPLIEINGMLIARLAEKRLTQKYWFGDFTDLVVDRTWQEISVNGEGQ